MKTNSRKYLPPNRFTSLLPMAAVTIGAALSGILSGCGSGSNGGDFSAAQSSVAVDQKGGFSVSPTFSNAITSNTHVFGAFGSACAIAPAQANTDEKCMVNVREQDLFMNEMKIGVNVPAGMCKYLEEIPYFYYNSRPGYGPSTYDLVVTDGVITSCLINGASVTPAGGFCGIGSGKISASGAVSCAFDGSKNIPAGNNCCAGNYSVTLKTVTNNPAATPPTQTSSTSATTGSYGGVIGSCIAGPGQSKLWPVHVTAGLYKGFPGHVIVKVPDNGFAVTLENRIPIVYTSGANDTISASNFYFPWASYLSAGNSVTAVVPPTINPAALPDGYSAGILPGNDSWEFLCEDESREVLHRIRLYVNEWDTNEQYASYLASNGTSGNPSNVAADREGTNCVNAGSISYGYCNDYFSLRDYALGTYGAGVYGAIGYFPYNTINDTSTATGN